MYTKEQVDAMLSQVEQEFETALGSIAKSEENIEEEKEIEIEASEEMEKSEDEVEVEAEEDDYETIDDLYASMTKSEQEAHYAAVKKSLFGMEEEKEEEIEAEEIEEIQKSEDNTEVEMLKSENEDLKKSYEELKSVVDQLLNVKKAPAQKAVTNVNYIAKSEETENEEIDFSEMSKSEITAKLKSIDYSELKKSDREAINNYYLDNGSVDSIKHLIRE
jgi:S-DNA-T family DNA segregation ATPase FtsK/SpoIIIE